jgi:hypothetical protein
MGLLNHGFAAFGLILKTGWRVNDHSHIKRVHHLRPSTRVRRLRPGFTGSFSTRSV